MLQATRGWLLRNLAELSEAQDGAGGAIGAALPTSRPLSVVASGREMVVLSVPAEVSVILLDIEGTTTPIAFVKVRGERERRGYLCLKTSQKIFSIADLVH